MSKNNLKKLTYAIFDFNKAKEQMGEYPIIFYDDKISSELEQHVKKIIRIAHKINPQSLNDVQKINIMKIKQEEV